MDEGTKLSILAVLNMLKTTLIENEVSAGFLKDSNELFFFDTKTYLQTKQYKGFKFKMEDLVK